MWLVQQRSEIRKLIIFRKVNLGALWDTLRAKDAQKLGSAATWESITKYTLPPVKGFHRAESGISATTISQGRLGF